LFSCIGSTRPSVWVSTHAEGIYPRSIARSYDDTFSPSERPKSFTEQLCYDWEKSAMLPADIESDRKNTDKKIRHVGLRVGVVLGRDGGMIKQSYLPFSLGLGGVLGSGEQQFAWIHIKDCVNLFQRAVENPDMSGFYNAVSPGQCSNEAFTTAFGKALNRPTFLFVPGFVLRTLGGAERSPMLLEGVRIKPKRTLESGFKFEFADVEKAMVDIVNS